MKRASKTGSVENKSPVQKASRKSAAGKGVEAASTAPNLKKLLRLLGRVDREAKLAEIKAELEAAENDLSRVADGEFPSGNFRDPKFLRMLLSAGLRVETLDSKGYSLLYQAAVSPQCVAALLNRGVEVNRVCEDYAHSTALMRAASLGALKSVELLLEAGADPKIKDQFGETALDKVDKHSRHASAIETLLRKTTRKA